MPSSRLAAFLSSVSVCLVVAACGGGSGGGDGFAGFPLLPSKSLESLEPGHRSRQRAATAP